MATPNQIEINSTVNTVNIDDNNNSITVSSSFCNTLINVTQSTTNIVTVATPGPQGTAGATGSPGTGSFETGSFATTGSNVFYGLQTISSSTDLSALDIHVKDDILWTFRTYNDTYSTSLIGLASWIDNDGISFLGTETDRPLHIYNNANYPNPTLLISSSGVIVNNTLTINNGITGSLFGTSSWANNSITSSFALNINSGLNLTASNLLVNNNINTTVLNAVSASIGYIEYVSGSAVIIGDQYIVLNSSGTPARFSGIQVYDSGSNTTSSIVWDSQTNHFVYENASGSTYNGGGFMSGPRNTGSLSNVTYPTQYRVLRGQGGDHLYDSNITDNDSNVSIGINTSITGTLNVSNGITGSLLGTSSWANNSISSSFSLTASYWSGSITNAATASYVLNAVSSSFATTSSYINNLNQSVVITGSTQGNVTALTISSNTASLNLNSGNFFTLQLVAGVNTHINPSNIKPGQSSILLLSTTGSATVSFPSTVKQPSGSSYTPTTTTGTDILTFVSLDSSNLYLVNVKNLI